MHPEPDRLEPKRRRRTLWGLGVIGFSCAAVALGAMPAPPSPAEGHIAFARSRGRIIDLYAITLSDGRVVRVTSGPGTVGTPAWSQDGRLLAFACRTRVPYNLWLFDPSSEQTTQLTKGRAIDAHPAWSPDGRTLVFASNRKGSTEFSLYLVDRHGSRPRRLAIGRSPSWSTSGDRIAFEREGDLFLTDLATGDEQRLTSSADVEATPAWAPDGRKIAFARADASGQHIYTLDPEDGTVERLTAAREADSAPAWSPDGEWIAFSRSNGVNSQIYIVNVDSGEERRLTSSDAHDVTPTWGSATEVSRTPAVAHPKC